MSSIDTRTSSDVPGSSVLIRTVSSFIYAGILAGLLWVVPWLHDELDQSGGALTIGAWHFDQPVRVYFATLVPAILILGLACLSVLDCLGSERRPFVAVPALGLLVAVPYLLLTILFGTVSSPPDVPGASPESMQSRLHLKVWLLGMGVIALSIYLSFALIRWCRHTSFLARTASGVIPTLLIAGLTIATLLYDRGVEGYNGVW